MSLFMFICLILLLATIANLIEAIHHQWAKENKYLAFIGPLIPVGLMLIKFWQNPFAPVNFFIIAIWVVILIVIILLWKKVHLIVDKFFAQEVAKDNVLAKLDPKDVEGSLQYLNEKEREFFLIYEFSDTAILWFGLEEYLTQTNGIHLQETWWSKARICNSSGHCSYSSGSFVWSDARSSLYPESIDQGETLFIYFSQNQRF